MGVGRRESGDSRLGQGELGPPGAEAVPAKLPVPIPVEVGPVVLLERHTSARWGISATGYLGVVEHGLRPWQSGRSSGAARWAIRVGRPTTGRGGRESRVTWWRVPGPSVLPIAHSGPA